MGQVEMQRGYGDVIVSRRSQIGAVIRCMDSAAKSEPVIGKAAWVSPLYSAGSPIFMEALPESLDSPHSLQFDGGECVDEKSSRHLGQVHTREHKLFPPIL